MKALAWNVKKQKLDLVELEEPKIQGADDVKLKVIKVGICGTDREEVHSSHVLTPQGKESIILGHEMLGRVVEVGPLVTEVKPGDLAIFTVRRECGECPACDQNASDMCYTSKYMERGIHGKDGFQTEYVIDRQKYLIKVPEDLLSTAVLCEPMSVVQKAIDQVIKVQKDRLPDWHDLETCLNRRRVLIAGVGAIGLLATVAFILRGATVWGYDIADPHSLRANIFKKLGGNYICAKEMKVGEIPAVVDHLDVIFEAAGHTELCLDLLSVLGTNGAYVITGITEKGKETTFDAGSALRNLVLKNQVLIGSVNANHNHWEQAIADLMLAKEKWGGLVDSLITQEYAAHDFTTPFFSRDQNEIKTVIGWNK